MFTVLNVVAPVFAIVALGYFAVRIRIYPAEGIKGLIAFVNNFATPCLLFRAMLNVDFAETFSLRLIGPYYLGALTVFVVGIIIARKTFGRSPGESVSAGFSGMFTNTVLLGIPILQRAYGDDAMPIVFTIVGTHAAILMTSAMLTMEFARRDGAPLGPAVLGALWRIAKNPLLIGIAVGLAGNLAGITLPETVDAFTLIMAQAIVPVALFGLGGALNEYKLAENWLLALVMSLLKLILHPLLVWIVMIPILNVDHNLARYPILLAAMPSGINVYIFATFYKRGQDIAANTVLITTVLSVATASVWLYILTF